jgi:hypothetical protein
MTTEEDDSVDREIRDALEIWLKYGGGHPTRFPVNPWPRRKGYTDAECHEIIVSEGELERSVLLKVCPRGESEASNHSLAWDNSPQFAKRHLVQQAYPPWPLKDGRVLTFQAFAGDDYRACLPLADFEPDVLRIAIPRIVRSLIREWNGDRRLHLRFERESDYLIDEAGTSLNEIVEIFGSSTFAKSQWLLWPDRRSVTPNPFKMLTGGSLGKNGPLEVIAGHAHRDLHLDNVVVKMDKYKEKLRDFWLLDLATYRSPSSLTSDPVRLLLSACAYQLPRMPKSDQETLLRSLVSPDQRLGSQHALALTMALVCQELQAAANQSKQGYPGKYLKQFLYSTIAQALVFTTFERLDIHRWWFFRLAALIARQCIDEDICCSVDDLAEVENLFER